MWALPGLNRRPSHYECAALTNCAKGPKSRLSECQSLIRIPHNFYARTVYALLANK